MWEKVAEVGAEIHRNQGVQAEGGLEPKEPPVGMLNSSLMVTDPGSGNRSTDPGVLEGRRARPQPWPEGGGTQGG